VLHRIIYGHQCELFLVLRRDYFAKTFVRYPREGFNIRCSRIKRSRLTIENQFAQRKDKFIMEHDITKLEQRLRQVDRKREAIQSIHALLNPVIHRPGWTTVAEFDLVMLTLDNLEHQLSGVERTQTALVNIAQQIDAGPNVIKPPVGTGVSHGGPESH
jgi:hypothetical protein